MRRGPVSSAPRVLVDERERPSGVPALLRKLGLRVEFRMLEVGDYVVSSRCAAERKSWMDFVRSLCSGRLFDQAQRLCETFEHPILIVEGDPSSILERLGSPRAFWGALVSITIEHGVSPFFTANPQQTADLIYTLARHWAATRDRGPIIPRRLRARSVEEVQLMMVSSLPGVGPKLADRILRRFGTVRRAFNASVAELVRVDGVGRVKAEKIAEVLNTPYRPAAKPQKQLQLDNQS